MRGFLNASSANEIVFVRGATEAINLVAQSWGRQHIGEGDEIVVTWLEHHANIVPWQQLATEKGARLKVVPVDDSGQVLLDAYGKLLGPKTKLVAFTQVSNALGTVTPAKQIIEGARSVGARVLLDGAQAVSHMSVDVQSLNPDWYVFSGHKVFAPTGIGVLDKSKVFMAAIDGPMSVEGGGAAPKRMIGWLVENQMTILSIGEILWDIFPDTERLGGAPFNFAVHAHRLGHRVILLSAVGDDERGRIAAGRAAALGLTTEFIEVVAGQPTGSVMVRMDAEGQPDFTIHRPAAYDCLTLDEGHLERLAEMRPDWIYFGTLYPMEGRAREMLRRLMDALPGARRLYDVNLRRGCYTPELVRELLLLADAVKMNDDEAELFPDSGEARCMAVTRGERGCTVRLGQDRAACPGYAVKVVDTVGAGDGFAAAFVHGIGEGWSAAKTGDFANRLGALVASRAGAVPEWSPGELGVE